jgi:hypothetical protein
VLSEGSRSVRRRQAHDAKSVDRRLNDLTYNKVVD